MILDLSFFSSDVVMSALLAFFVGMGSVMAYNRLKGAGQKRDYRADEAVVEAVVLEYTRRLKDYDRAIAELRMKADLVELRVQQQQQQNQQPVSQRAAGDVLPLPPSPLQQQQYASRSILQPHAQAVSEHVAVTQHPIIVEERNYGGEAHYSSGNINNGEGGEQQQNGTIDYILKLLAERPRTSREVHHAIGRTREHTARLMKKLHDMGLVSRDSGSKPFRYMITDPGRSRLAREKAPGPVPAEMARQHQ